MDSCGLKPALVVCGCFARVTALKRGVNEMIGGVHIVDSLLQCGVNRMLGSVLFINTLLHRGVNGMPGSVLFH